MKQNVAKKRPIFRGANAPFYNVPHMYGIRHSVTIYSAPRLYPPWNCAPKQLYSLEHSVVCDDNLMGEQFLVEFMAASVMLSIIVTLCDL